jgi:octaprenyl-diphosphate synthase
VGKPTGNDIKEKKLTLPLIYTLNTVDRSSKRQIIRVVKHNNKDRKKVDWVIEQVKQTGGIDYATKRMNEYKEEAIRILHQFPENEIRQGLEDLVRYVTERKY